jgi:hypothetical protein
LYIEKDMSPMMKIKSLERGAYFLSGLISAAATALEGRDLSRGTG